MIKYKYLIFDLDNTLVDNNASIAYAFKKVLEKLSIPFSEDLLNKWYTDDMEWWHKFEIGESVIPEYISKDEIVNYLMAQRFVVFFEDLNLSYEEAVDINDYYIEMLASFVAPIEGALELLQELSKDYVIIIATNGPKGQAINKVAKAKMSGYTNYIVSVEDTVYPKPMPEFFNYIYELIDCWDKSKMLIIGDSLRIDILSGMNNGIDTCWFNLHHEVCSDEYKPTYIVNKLLKIKDCVKDY